ncbi:MAG: hypothetical protein DRQ55_00875 [Planctomycetota bacterium]|nr:MAG: hypothetical protein DRQ55_00875 [Planctomycetota bacterium]
MTHLERLGPAPDSGRPRWKLVLLPLEGAILKGLPAQLEALLADPGSNRRVIDRLFPPSYADPTEEREHRRLLGDGLLGERRDMLVEVRSLLAGTTPAGGAGGAAGVDAAAGASTAAPGLDLILEAGSLDLLLRFLNDVRLVLATDLGIEGNLSQAAALDPGDPDAPKQALLEYLGGLEAILVDAISREL